MLSPRRASRGAGVGTALVLEPEAAAHTVGLIGCGVLPAMFAGPLAAAKKSRLLEERGGHPARFYLFSTVNTITWIGYGLLVIDDMHLGPERHRPRRGLCAARPRGEPAGASEHATSVDVTLYTVTRQDASSPRSPPHNPSLAPGLVKAPLAPLQRRRRERAEQKGQAVL